jgi:hypothetical protein
MQGLTTPGISASGVALFKGEQAVDKAYRAQDAAIANPDPPGVFECCPSGLSFARNGGQSPCKALSTDTSG